MRTFGACGGGGVRTHPVHPPWLRACTFNYVHKREYYGFRGVINKWFSSYLQGQTKTTQIGPNVSLRTDVTCGVPQGSVLGPLLFLLWVNDVSSINFNFYRFADETNNANKNLKSLELIVNQELRKLLVWLTANRLIERKRKQTVCTFKPYSRKINLPT